MGERRESKAGRQGHSGKATRLPALVTVSQVSR